MEKDVLLETLQRALKDNTTKAEEVRRLRAWEGAWGVPRPVLVPAAPNIMPVQAGEQLPRGVRTPPLCVCERGTLASAFLFLLGPVGRCCPPAQIVAGVRATAQRREQGLRTQLAERDKQIATMQDMLGTSKESKLFNGGDRAFMDDLLLTVLEQKDALADKLDALSNEYLKLKAKLGMSEFEKEKLEAESRAQQRRSAGSIGSAGSVGSLRQRSEDFTGAAPAAASAGRLFGSAPSVSSFRQTSDPGPRLSADSSRPRRESSDVVFDVANSRSMSLASVGEVDATMTEEVASHLANLEERGATANELAEADRTIQELRAQLEQSKASLRQDSRQRRKQVKAAKGPLLYCDAGSPADSMCMRKRAVGGSNLVGCFCARSLCRRRRCRRAAERRLIAARCPLSSSSSSCLFLFLSFSLSFSLSISLSLFLSFSLSR